MSRRKEENVKKGVKKAVMGAVFLAAVNINGCAYGPMPNRTNVATVTPTEAVATPTEETATPTEVSPGNKISRVDEPVTSTALLISETSDSDAI